MATLVMEAALSGAFSSVWAIDIAWRRKSGICRVSLGLDGLVTDFGPSGVFDFMLGMVKCPFLGLFRYSSIPEEGGRVFGLAR